MKALWSRTSTGQEGLIGEVGVVRTRLAPRGQVFLHGELWNAQGDGEIEPGTSVRVTGVDGLTLRVVPVQVVTAASDAVTIGRSR